jgi:hypothetical protein
MITLDGTNGITTPDVEVDSIGTSTSTAVTVRTNGAERLRVDASGNVGVGTNSPTFDDGTGIQLSRTGVATYRATSTTGSVSLEMKATSSLVAVSSRGNYPLVFETDGSERARIDASGKLQVNTTGRNGMISVANVVGTFPAIHTRTETTAGQGLIEFHNPNGVCGEIVTSGSSTSYNTSSDYRLKEDVQPMVGASDRLMALKPVNFAWKADGSRVDGFLAHEAQEVVPECVTGEKDAVDGEGNPQYQGIDQSKIVPLLVAALQEALTKIEALEARVAALETNA